jgi:hypothetical protein
MLTTAQWIQLIIAFGILNVWILRFGKPSPWRGGEAGNMTEEFAAYGLSATMMYAVGFAKVVLALLLVVGIWIPVVAAPAAAALALIMLGAIAMHVKVRDPVKKSVPAALMLALCVAVVVLS